MIPTPNAVTEIITDDELHPDYIIPSVSRQTSQRTRRLRHRNCETRTPDFYSQQSDYHQNTFKPGFRRYRLFVKIPFQSIALNHKKVLIKLIYKLQYEESVKFNLFQFLS